MLLPCLKALMNRTVLFLAFVVFAISFSSHGLCTSALPRGMGAFIVGCSDHNDREEVEYKLQGHFDALQFLFE